MASSQWSVVSGQKKKEALSTNLWLAFFTKNEKPKTKNDLAGEQNRGGSTGLKDFRPRFLLANLTLNFEP